MGQEENIASEEVAKVISDEDKLKLQAQQIFMSMKAEAEEEHGSVGDIELDHEEAVDDLAKEHYNRQLEEIKKQQQMAEEERDEEIQELRKLLEATRNAAPSAPSSVEKIKPLIQNVSLNGVKSQLMICDFKPEGRIGLSFKRYGSQFFVVDTSPQGQVAKYEGITAGLLLYQCVSYTAGQGNGQNIRVKNSDELAKRVLVEFGKGKSIQ